MTARAPLLPLPTPVMRLYVQHSRRAQRRTKTLTTAVAVIATTIIALLFFLSAQQRRIAFQQRELANTQGQRAQTEARNARLQQLQRRGASALTQIRSGDITGSLEPLREIVENDRAQDLPAYHLIYRFLRPLLTPVEVALAKLPRPTLFRWRGRQFALTPTGGFTPIPGPAIDSYAFANGGRYLLTADVKSLVCVYDLMQFAQLQCFSANGGPADKADVRDHVDAFYGQPGTGVVAILVDELELGGDEDSEIAEEALDSFMLVLSKPIDRPRKLTSSEYQARLCGAGPCGFRRLASAKNTAVRALDFPSVRPESDYWHPVVTSSLKLPDDWKISLAQTRRAEDDRLRRLTFHGADEPLNNGISLLKFFRLNSKDYVAIQGILGAKFVKLYVCDVVSEVEARKCRGIEQTVFTETTISPDSLHAVLWSPEKSFGMKIVALPSVKECKSIDGPNERTIAVDFTKDGTHLVVLSRDGELWSYVVGTGCDIRLENKVFNAVLERLANIGQKDYRPKIEAAFVDESSVVVTHGNRNIIDIDVRTGLLKWSRSGFGLDDLCGISWSLSPSGTMLAGWTSHEVQLIHLDTGVSVSSNVGFLGPKPKPKGKITRVLWSGDSVVADWYSAEMGGCGTDLLGVAFNRRARRSIYARLSPADAELKLIRGASTRSLTDLVYPQK